MGEVMDANEVLTLTCQRLKDEAGRPQDFSYGDLAAIKQAQAGEVRRGDERTGREYRRLSSSKQSISLLLLRLCAKA